ncbi:MAG: glycosyltransferase [Gemmatimonadota bacterium]|nr:glycosyltransferase [Gemmatimonadota bacterium]
MSSFREAAGSAAPRIAVAELELCGPIGPVAVDPQATWVRVLVRAAGVPITWMWMDPDDEAIPGDSLGRGLVGVAPALARGAVRARDRLPDAVPTPPISIVICTRDRQQSLARCLDAVLQLDYPEYEIVLIDNAPSSDGTAHVAARYPARYIREPVPGLDWARNRGIAEARHDIIAFTDDDVRVDRQWLRGLAKGFANEAVGLVTGFVAPGSLESEAEQLFELAYGGMGKGFAARDLEPSNAEPSQLLATHYLGVGANMAVRRAVLHQVGGFDTALDVGTPSRGGGDLDMFHRVLLTGRVAHYEPSAIVWHFHRTTRAGLRRQMYDNGRAFGTYLLVRLRDGRLPRLAVAGLLMRWLLWLLGRIPRRFLRRERMPLPCLAAELWGALHAPYAYLRTYACDRRLRRAMRASSS